MNPVPQLMQRMRTLLAGLVLLSGLMAPAMAQKPHNLTGGELALLPEYCNQTMGMYPGAQPGTMGPDSKRWLTLMGRSFMAMHHYCWGLINERRAQASGTPRVRRDFLLRHAGGDYRYVLTNAEPGFRLLPEIFVKLGDIHALLGESATAIDAYQQAVLAQPSWWRPYSRWAEVAKNAGLPKMAMAQLEAGLRMQPDSPELRAQYKAYGGDADKFVRSLPKREPAAAQPADAAASAALPSASAPAPAASGGLPAAPPAAAASAQGG